MREGLIHKTYLALCQGDARGPPLGPIRHGFRRLNKDHPSGKPSLLCKYDPSIISKDSVGGVWQLAELVILNVRRVQFNHDEFIGNFWECEIQLITGRTHQIRLQLAALGYPIYGDTRYTPVSGLLDDGLSDGEGLFGPEPKTEVGLHCASLEFPAEVMRGNNMDITFEERVLFKAAAPWWRSFELG